MKFLGNNKHIYVYIIFIMMSYTKYCTQKRSAKTQKNTANY